MNRCIRQDLDPSTPQQNHYDNQQQKTTHKGEGDVKKGLRLELLRKLLLVQKHVRILIPLIKPILHLLHTKQNPVYISVPRQRHDRRVRLPFRRRRFLLLHRVVILCRNPVLIWGLSGRGADLVFYIREGRRFTISFM